MTLNEIGVLIVDDVNTMRVQIRELVKTNGISQIYLAGNGEEAKKVLENGKIHLILCDWMMTPGDGLMLLQYVRGNNYLKKCAFIMITAEGTKDKVIEA